MFKSYFQQIYTGKEHPSFRRCLDGGKKKKRIWRDGNPFIQIAKGIERI